MLVAWRAFLRAPYSVACLLYNLSLFVLAGRQTCHFVNSLVLRQWFKTQTSFLVPSHGIEALLFSMCGADVSLLDMSAFTHALGIGMAGGGGQT